LNRNSLDQIHLVRRVLVPFFIMAVPVAAMIAFVLYYKQAKPSAGTEAPPQASVFGADAWPTVRADAQLTGTAPGNLPARLKLAWRFETKGAIKAAPVVADGRVFAASTDKHLYALDAANGTELWRFEADDELEAGALFHAGVVYIGSNGGTFYALEAGSGKMLWTFEAGGKIAGAANAATTESQTVIVFGSWDNNLYGLDAGTGVPLFKHPAASYINSTPAVIGPSAVFGSCDGFLYRVALAEGAESGKVDAGSYIAASPAGRGTVAYVGTYEGLFFAADIDTAGLLWSFDNKTRDAFVSSPAVTDDCVVVGCRDNKLYCFERSTGQVRWTFEASEWFESSPVICGGTVAVGNDDGRLYLVDLQTGREVFSYTLGSPVASSAAIAQNRLFIGCDNGLLFAFVSD
jgi:eukaryotic-like serine/threonine-protein kinase